MDAGLDLKLKVESSTECFQAQTMLPLFSSTEDPKSFQFYMPTFNHHDQPQFQNARLLPSMMTSATSTMEDLSSLENFNGYQDNNGMMTFKRQRALDETASFFTGDGSGSGQFQQLNGVGNVLEPMMSGLGFGVGSTSTGVGFYNQYYPYQAFGGFKVGSANEPNNIQSQQGPDNLIDSVVEKRHRRMIKNRESAARSRARRLAYNAQLMLEIEQLRKENEVLRRVFQTLCEIANMKNEKLQKGVMRITSSMSLQI